MTNNARAWFTGPADAPVLNFDIPSGPRGAKGDPGDQTPSTVQDWTGTVVLRQFPHTYVATLKGAVTLTIQPLPQGSGSATVTLVLTQDTTGGRILTWPSDILWPEGVKVQPSTAAGSTSVIHLLWTGTTWLGLNGGKNFA